MDCSFANAMCLRLENFGEKTKLEDNNNNNNNNNKQRQQHAVNKNKCLETTALLREQKIFNLHHCKE